MTFFKNIALLVVVIILSYFTAEYFGTFYDKFSPLYDNTLGLGEDVLKVFMGFPFAYTFFLILIFKSFAWGDRNKWTGWLVAPALLFFAAGDLKHFYLPIALGFIALGLSTLLRKVLLSR